MKQILTIVVFILGAFAMSVANAFAQDVPASSAPEVTVMAGSAALPKIKPTYAAVVDFNYILRECSASKSVASQLDALRRQYRDEMESQEEELKKAQEEWKKLKLVLDKDALIERRKEFEEKVSMLQKSVQHKKRQLDLGYENAMVAVRHHITAAVASVAEDVGANVILSKTSVIIAGRELEITQQVLDRVNRDFPAVDVVIEEIE